VDAVVGHQRNLVINALSDGQPVQRVTKYRSNVLVELSASDEAHSHNESWSTSSQIETFMNSRLNCSELTLCRKDHGKLFHTQRPATSELLSLCVRGTMNIMMEVGHSRWRPLSEMSLMSSAGYICSWSDNGTTAQERI